MSKSESHHTPRQVNLEDLKCPNGVAPKGLPPCAADAYLLFQVSDMIYHGQLFGVMLV